MHTLYVIFWFIWGTGLFLVLAYGWAMLFGAPYLPTLKATQDDAIELIGLKKGQVLVDLGCGDGGVLVRAANKGYKAIGYEINPFIAVFAWLRTRRFGRQVKIKLGNFWHADLSQVDGIFVFLITHYMEKLDKLITEQPHKQIKVVSHGFEIPGRKYAKKKGALFLYIYEPTRKPR